MSLRGKTVLVTRRREQSTELVELLERRGALVEVVPFIEILPPVTWIPCDEALGRLRSYQAVLLTSANAARFFLGRGRERGVSFAEARVVAIGEATRRAVAECGVGAEPGGAFDNARDLARHLLSSPVDGQAYLFPCGDLAREGMPEMLRQSGARVDQVEVYRTVAPPPEILEPARTVLARRDGAVVIFGSPSAVRNLRDFLGEGAPTLLERVVVAAIGITTADEARNCGIIPRIVARHPSAEDLVAAIDEYFA